MSRPHLKIAPTDAAAPKRRQSKRGLETERKLIAAADQVFWAQGYNGATIMQIIETSGLSVGSFYHRFADKEALLKTATENISKEFEKRLVEVDFSCSANGDLFTLFYNLVLNGRDLVARHRGIYRAMSEVAQTDILQFGALANITPQLIASTQKEIGSYADQFQSPPDDEAVSAAVQLIAMTVMQTELGLGPSFPKDVDVFAQTIARAACGILGYIGPTARPVTEPKT